MKPMRLKITHDEEGTTLVELLAAIAILSIIVTSFLAFFIQSANTNKMTNEVNEATFVAQGVMEELTYYSSEGYTAGAANDLNLYTVPDGFTLKFTHFEQASGSSLYKIVITVSEGSNDRAQMETRLPFASEETVEETSTE